MARAVTFTYDGKEYTLQYNRESVKSIEKSGFDASNGIKDKPVSTMDALYKGSFLMHHSGISSKKADEILSMFKDKVSLFEVLYEMYLETASTLFDEPEEGKNLEWTVQQ